MTDVVREPRGALTRWLELLRPSTAVFCRAEVRAPWGFRVEGRDTATFHVVTAGRALLEVDGIGEPVELQAGDLALLPTGAPHVLRDAPGSRVPQLEEAVAGGEVRGKWVSFGGGGPTAEMVCGACELGVPGSRAAARALPPLLRHPVEASLVEIVKREAEGLSAGREAVLLQLLTLVVLQALRAHLLSRAPVSLDAAVAPELVLAVAHVHEHLGDEIRVSDLCARTGVSRTVLTERFRSGLGVSPIHYVRRARLAKAADLLRTGGVSLARVARSVGYGSASAFSRAFRTEYGVPPGAFRRRPVDDRSSAGPGRGDRQGESGHPSR